MLTEIKVIVVYANAHTSASQNARFRKIGVGKMGHVPTSIIDANLLFRSGLAQLLSGSLCRIVAAVSSVADLPSSLADAEAALFIVGPDNEGTSDIVQQIHQSFPRSRILVLSGACNKTEMCEAFNNGANGYLSKSVTLDVLVRSLELLLEDVQLARSIDASVSVVPLENNARRQVEEGKGCTNQHIDDRHKLQHNLSEREFNVLRLMSQGYPNKIIAYKLAIAEATVKVHVKAILRKIGAQNRTQAAIWARDNGALGGNDTDGTERGRTHRVRTSAIAPSFV